VIITDAQAHIWPPEGPDRPWIEGGRDFAHGDQFPVDDLLSAMKGASVDRVVLVPPSFEGDRNDACLAAVAAHPDTFRVMGRISLTDPASRGRLATWREQPGMLGIRLAFSRGPAAHWLDDGTADWLWPEAEAARLPVMVFAPGLLHRVADLAERHPGIPFALCHLGIRTDLRDDAVAPVIDELLGLARFENVAVKASCLPSNTSQTYPFPALHDHIRRVFDAFGPRRTFWGSDVTRLPETATYDETRRLFTDELDFLSGEDLEWVMGRAVSEWLRWYGP
jgi:predicted TIM-barrel fold metal-dependent hydrolase